MTDEATPFMEAEFLGDKVIEMAERLLTAHRIVPGARATYSFKMDDVTFKIVMEVVE